MIKTPIKNTQSGAAMLISVIFFLAISLTIVIGIATPILKQVKDSVELVRSKETLYLAEGTLEDSMYRLVANKTLASGDSVTINGSTATIALTTTSSGKIITATANIGGRIRKMEAQVVTGIGTSFNYGIQVGSGGFVLAGGSKINGNVYSNGSIIATNGVTITGSAIAANSSSLTADQQNNSPTPISSCSASTCISFRNVSTAQDLAQQFQVATSAPLNKVQFYIKKVGSPSDITVRIVTDNAGSPSTNNVLSSNGTLTASLVSTSFGWVEVVFPDNPTLDPNTVYWLVLDNSTQNASNYYVMGANSAYSSGVAKVGAYNGTWNATSPSGLDAYFQLYVGGFYSVIGSGSYVGSVNIGTAGVGDAWAHTVQGASVAGTIYCASGTTNNKACNTTRTDPSQQPMPVSDANIQQWKDEAIDVGTGWTYSGDLTIGASGTTTTTLKHVTGNLTINGGGTADLTGIIVDGNVTITSGATLKAGPMKIGGNFTIGSTGFTMKGTTWIVGNVTVSSGASVKMDSGYGANSGTFLSDGYMILSGGASFSGSGTSGSYPMLLTTSVCPVGAGCSGNNAIEFSGGSGAVVLNAQNGTLHMSGGTNARSLIANEVSVDGGGVVTYDSGIANLNFSSGPSGGYNVSRWQEVQ